MENKYVAKKSSVVKSTVESNVLPIKMEKRNTVPFPQKEKQNPVLNRIHILADKRLKLRIQMVQVDNELKGIQKEIEDILNS